jgi:hypothetical protein
MGFIPTCVIASHYVLGYDVFLMRDQEVDELTGQSRASQWEGHCIALYYIYCRPLKRVLQDCNRYSHNTVATATLKQIPHHNS